MKGKKAKKAKGSFRKGKWCHLSLTWVTFLEASHSWICMNLIKNFLPRELSRWFWCTKNFVTSKRCNSKVRLLTSACSTRILKYANFCTFSAVMLQFVATAFGLLRNYCVSLLVRITIYYSSDVTENLDREMYTYSPEHAVVNVLIMFIVALEWMWYDLQPWTTWL